MTFSSDHLLKQVDIINQDNYVFGNEVLYQMCSDINKILPKNKEDASSIKRLGSAIWLIGRSYSASPERRKWAQNSDDGLGDFFWNLAVRMTSTEEYDTFRKEICNINTKNYKYDRLDEDIELLIASVRCVKTLNEMIMKAIQTMDESEAVRNNVSFCSKFLHFLVPDVFFIIDSYSNNGGKALFKKKDKMYLKITGNSVENQIEIGDKVIELFKNFYIFDASKHQFVDDVGKNNGLFPTQKKISEYSSAEKNIRDYWHHVTRGYSLARWLNEKQKKCAPQIDGDSDSCYMPRLVDSILMRIKQ